MSRLLRRLAAAAALVVVAGARDGVAQPEAGGRAPGTSAVAEPSAATAAALRELPFAIGERLEYDAKVGPFRVGSGFMEVVGVETLRGREALHLQMHVSGSALGWRVREAFDSWVEPRSFASLRLVHDQEEGRRTNRTRTWDIFPERGVYVERGSEEGEQRSVANPLDDGSFLYWVRTVPLEVGRTYEFERYFRPDRNPVRVRVARRERVRVPAGEFDAIVLQPTIKTKGLLSESARTELWLTDDDRRLLLKLQSALPFGSLSLHLRTLRPAR